MASLDLEKLDGDWYLTHVDKMAFKGYVPECQKMTWGELVLREAQDIPTLVQKKSESDSDDEEDFLQQDKRMTLAQVTELKDGMLSGYIFQSEFHGDGRYVAQMWGKDLNGQVVDTDYSTYLIAQLCDKVGLDMKEELLFIYSRDPNAKTEDLLQKAQEKMG